LAFAQRCSFDAFKAARSVMAYPSNDRQVARQKSTLENRAENTRSGSYRKKYLPGKAMHEPDALTDALTHDRAPPAGIACALQKMIREDPRNRARKEGSWDFW
jgi:hypothetical protein